MASTRLCATWPNYVGDDVAVEGKNPMNKSKMCTETLTHEGLDEKGCVCCVLIRLKTSFPPITKLSTRPSAIPLVLVVA